MKTYLLNIYHDIYEDSYENGEGDFANSWEDSVKITAETPEDAVKQCFKDELYIDFDINNIETDENIVYTTITVDVENTTPTEFQYEDWRNGKITLYSDNISIHVAELVLTNVNFK